MYTHVTTISCICLLHRKTRESSSHVGQYFENGNNEDRQGNLVVMLVNILKTEIMKIDKGIYWSCWSIF